MTQRKSSNVGIISKFWNEFLFARHFEYETPLTPDEIANALQKIEDRKHKQYFLSMFNLTHRFYYNSSNDKSGEFDIELETTTRKKWWDTDTAMIEATGTIQANPETGLTTVSGSTRFNRRYYILILLIFMPNFYLQSVDGNLGLQLFWIAFTVIFWYVMYTERNKLAGNIDDIIMHAKSEQSIANLVNSEAFDNLVDEEATQGYIIR